MATPERKSMNLKPSVYKGSEEIFDNVCEPCQNERGNIEAFGFCTDCNEYLCQQCYGYHRRVTVTKNHCLLDKLHMPKVKVLRSSSADDCSQKCPSHPDRILEYYCKSHDALGCTICMTTNHRRCDNVDFILDIADRVENSSEYKDLIAKLKDLEKNVHDNKRKIEENITKVEKAKEQAKSKIAIYRKEINDFFNRLEHDIMSEIDVLMNEDAKRMTSLSDACNSLSLGLQKTTHSIENKGTTTNNRQMFVEMKLTKQKTALFEEELHTIEKDNNIKLYTFEPEHCINDVLKNVNSFGELTALKEQIDNGNESKRSAKLTTEINIQSKLSFGDCSIVALEMLNDDRLIAADYKTKSIKLINTKKNKLLSSKSMPSVPFSITKVACDQVAVTLPYDGMIQFISVSGDSLSKHHTINVDSLCRGIAYSEGKLIVAYNNSKKIDIMDMNGSIIRTIRSDIHGKFTSPKYVAVSRDNSTFYVTDTDNNSIICLTLDGHVRAMYKDDEHMRSPRQLAIDKHGTVYVCCNSSHKILQLTQRCTFVQVLLGSSEVFLPKAATYCDKEDKLYIGQSTSKTLKVFSVQ